MSKKRILFISHEASRTGAPLVLLWLLNWLKTAGIEFDVLLLRTGVLEPEFHKLGKVFLWERQNTGIIWRIFRKLLCILKIYRLPLLWQLRRRKYSLIYANTVCSGSVASKLSSMTNCPVIMHVHELDSAICRITGFTECIKHVNCVLAVSEMARNNLINTYHVPPEKIVLAHAFIPDIVTTDPRFDLKKQLGIPPENFIVGVCGSLNWRKGCDLLLPTVKLFFVMNPSSKVTFVWVGGAPEPQVFEELNFDLRKLGLDDKVILTGEVLNAADYMKGFDILLLISREESFSIVAAEANYLGKTVLCFENVIGWTEYACPDDYIAVPYLDIKAVCEAIAEFYSDKAKLESAKRITVARTARFTVSNCAPVIFNIINNQINAHRNGSSQRDK